jgi:predicted outer membrane repeat protein
MSARSIRRQAVRRNTRERARNAAIASAVALGGTAALASSAEAATFNVTNLNDDGAGSLRAAVTAANLTAAADTVTFASGLTGTIELTTGGIPIEAALDIQGPGADVLKVSATDTSSHFGIETDITGADFDDVSIAGLKLTDGNAAVGGAISSEYSDLNLTDMVFKGNYSSGNSGAVDFDDGIMTVTGSEFTGNTAASGGGAIYFDATDVASDRNDLIITDSLFAGNSSSGSGGGLYFDDNGDDLVIDRSTFRANSTNSVGGGLNLYSADEPDDRSLVIRESLITGNSTNGSSGGGIYYDGTTTATPGAGLLVENSTISANRAYANTGGGVYVGDGDNPVRFVSATITDNASTGSTSGGGIYTFAEDVELTNTIVADNSAEGSVEDDLGSDGAVAGDGSFVINNSLIGDDISPAGSNILNSTTAPGSNIFEADPKLGPLADNGGPTFTHLPSLTSPVIDAGSTALTTDQRGFARPVDRPDIANKATSNGADMGAVEVALEPDTAVNGGTIEVPDKVKVKKKVKIKVTAGSAEDATAVVSGEVKSGDLVFDLKSQTTEIAAGGLATVNLVPTKKKSSKKIAKLLSPKKGKAKKATAFIELQLTDKAGNEAILTDKAKLQGKKKKKKK